MLIFKIYMYIYIYPWKIFFCREKSEFVESRRLRDTTKVEGINNRCLYAVFLSYIEIYNNGIFDLLEELVCDPITGYK